MSCIRLATPFVAPLVALGCLLLSTSAALANPVAECASDASASQFASNGWGHGVENQRYQQDAAHRLNRDNVHQLKLKWAYKLDTNSPHSYPLVTEDTVFIGTSAGNLLALDRSSGCLRWRFEANGDIRTAIVHGVTTTANGNIPVLFFGTIQGRVHAVNAANGKPLWEQDVRTHPFAVVTGTPTFHNNRLYVPVSSIEVVLAGIPIYGCCNFRGSVVALDAASGAEQWRAFTIDEEAKVTGSHYWFVEKYGPSGAPVWSAPTIDAQLGQLYMGTGENYSSPPTSGSDAIFAVALQDGKERWRKQFTERDAYNMSCETSVNHPNCPEENGPDLDFGAPPVLATLADGQRLLLVGQKSGDVRALDPASGNVIWQKKLGLGGKLGGIHWGMAVDPNQSLLFVPMSDRTPPTDEADPQPGLTALDIRSGDIRWQQPASGGCEGRERCHPGYSAAILATSSLVFATQLNGLASAFDSSTGKLLWQVDTWREYAAVNGKATGGSIDVHGPQIAGDMLFVSSGYGTFGQQGGNAFLAFQLDTKATEVNP